MITALLTGVLILAAPPYTEVQLNELYAGSLNSLNGTTPLNARRVDLNNDQYVDLLLPDRVLFQRDGRYFPEEAVELPDIELSPGVDVFSGAIYIRSPKSLKVYQYREDVWEVLLDMAMEWPMGSMLERAKPSDTATTPEPDEEDASDDLPEEKTSDRPPSFERYVYDIDEDGIPELLFPLQDGVHIYQLTKGHYTLLPIVPIFPKTTLIPTEDVASIPSMARGLSFPDQHLVFHCTIDKGMVSLLTKKKLNDGQVRFSEIRYRLIKTEVGYTAEVKGTPKSSIDFSSHMQPCRLNPDDHIDFAGGALDYTSSLALLTPIYTTLVQTSPEHPIQRFRTKSFTPHVLLTDVNQDGFLDLILERTDITDGGLRETLNRFLTQRKFSHQISVHYQQADGQFSLKADVKATVHIKLDQTPIRLSAMFERYQAGKLINITGDFNRDGQNDLVVQINPDTLALYLNQGRSFSKKPDYTIPIEDFESFHVVDVNEDAYADIVLQGVAENETGATHQTRVLFFQDDPAL